MGTLKCVSAHDYKPVWEHSSPLFDMLNSLSLDEPTQQGKPPAQAEIPPIMDVLKEIQTELETALYACKKEQEKLNRGEVDANEALPATYAYNASMSVIRLERLLYTYTDTARFNRFSVWQYINAHKKTNCEKVGLQISDDLIIFRIPYLPRRHCGNNAVVNHMLAAKIFQHTGFPKWQCWTAVFHHVYPTNTKDIPRDIDNYDYKKTIDLIAYALGASDNAFCFDMSMRTVFTDNLTRGVYIEVRPKSSENEELPPWQIQWRGKEKNEENAK